MNFNIHPCRLTIFPNQTSQSGEYVRHYARGKHVLEQLGGKTLVMTLLGHEDPNVRLEIVSVTILLLLLMMMPLLLLLVLLSIIQV